MPRPWVSQPLPRSKRDCDKKNHRHALSWKGFENYSAFCFLALLLPLCPKQQILAALYLGDCLCLQRRHKEHTQRALLRSAKPRLWLLVVTAISTSVVYRFSVYSAFKFPPCIGYWLYWSKHIPLWPNSNLISNNFVQMRSLSELLIQP